VILLKIAPSPSGDFMCSYRFENAWLLHESILMLFSLSFSVSQHECEYIMQSLKYFEEYRKEI